MDERNNTDMRRKGSRSPDVMIFGSGACAQKIAANLNDHGIHAWLAAREDSPPSPRRGDGLHWLSGIELSICRGFAKNFDLKLRRGNLYVDQHVPAIVLAEDDHRSPNYAPYGLEPNPRVLSISALEEKIHHVSPQDWFDSGARIVFLCGWQNDSHPAIAQRMLTGCLHSQRQSGLATYFMTGNLKVAASGAEALVQAAKRAGALFLKFTRDYPTIQTLADGRFEIHYLDELTRTPFQFRADWIVVDETIEPGQHLEALAHRLAITQDDLGFAQSDNVHRLSNATNRRGVFVAGGSRGILSEEEQLADADQVTMNVLAYLQDLDVEPLPAVEIVRGRCVRCLTCHRLCPHEAIEIGQRISVVAGACQSCGICVASCPARAIEMEGMQIGPDIYRWLRKAVVAEAIPKDPPLVMVFGCARSAGQALALSRQTGHVLPMGVQFVEVPCGGTISSHHLLTAFDAGADGVMLCICHTGNCRSEIGNQVARKRADSVRILLKEAGVDDSRLNIASVAANMGNEFIFMINAFADRIKARNPSSLPPAPDPATAWAPASF
ncbi:MAG: hydrogenase iron-sulfur subunit [Desulfobacteraceae bacterium]|jgi:coenzyme F420-reducing hydrogenase delta subunit/NAD-dependent dihydropyrimidine dehydrogenase PreA subunit|nr:hydrogenase iron-sulfur subunit [Desulfobacteraceae bacterium]